MTLKREVVECAVKFQRPACSNGDGHPGALLTRVEIPGLPANLWPSAGLIALFSMHWSGSQK